MRLTRNLIQSRNRRADFLLPFLLSFFLSSVLLPSSFSQKAVYCAKLPGLLERNLTYEESAKAITFAGSLTGDSKPFLYVRKTSMRSQAKAAALGMMPLAVKLDNHLNEMPHLTSDEAEEEGKRPELQKSLNEFIGLFKDRAPDPNWYLYSNSPLFEEFFKKKERLLLEHPDRGVVLLMDKAGEKIILNQAIEELASYLDVGLVFIDGETPTEISAKNLGKSRPVILNLKSNQVPDESAAIGVSVATQLQKATPENSLILFMMPESIGEAEAWGFSKDKADRYVTNGKRILKDLTSYGFKSSIVRVKAVQSLMASSKPVARGSKSLVVVIGESAGGGNVRVPGESARYQVFAGAISQGRMLGVRGEI
jgi:hypothetical protein